MDEKPSELFMEAIEDSKVLLIIYNKQELASTNLPKVENLFKKYTQQTHWHSKEK